MKKVKFRHSTSRLLLLTVVFLISFTNFNFAQEDLATAGDEQAIEAIASEPGSGDVANGKALFNSLCAACHKPYSKSIGPALNGVTERRSIEWIETWISNSAEMIASGDAQAVAIYEEYNKTAMPAFPQLTQPEIGDILAYVEQPKPTAPVVAGGGATDGGSSGGGVSNNVILMILAFVLVMLLVVLFLVNKTLRSFATASGVVIPVKEKRKPLYKSFVENQFLVLVTAIIVLLASGYMVYGFFMQVGVDQGLSANSAYSLLT